MSRCRHLVADGDRDDSHYPAPGPHNSETRLGNPPLPGGRGGDLQRARAAGEGKRGRVLGVDPAVAGHAARDLSRPGPLRKAILEPLPRRLLHRRRGEARRGRLLLAAVAGGRRHQRLWPPYRDLRGGVRVGRQSSVAEAAVIGVTHEIKGQAIAAFVTLKEGHKPGPQMMELLKEHVVKKIGALARPEQILFAGELPKTRSGKIMRRLLRDIAEGRVLGDTTTLADPAVVETLKARYEEEAG